MTELRQRMVNDMIVRRMAEKTRTSYTHAVAGLAKFYRRSPDHGCSPGATVPPR